MPTATYREFRGVLQRAGFQLARSKKHEMLRQARLSQVEFLALLQGR